MFDDDSGFKKKKKVAEGELDITPMIDVTFLLLIFFMVTSTMQGTPDRDIPPSLSGSSQNPAAMLELVVVAPVTANGDAQILLEGKTMTLEELKSAVAQEAAVKEAVVGWKELAPGGANFPGWMHKAPTATRTIGILLERDSRSRGIRTWPACKNVSSTASSPSGTSRPRCSISTTTVVASHTGILVESWEGRTCSIRLR